MFFSAVKREEKNESLIIASKSKCTWFENKWNISKSMQNCYFDLDAQCTHLKIHFSIQKQHLLKCTYADLLLFMRLFAKYKSKCECHFAWKPHSGEHEPESRVAYVWIICNNNVWIALQWHDFQAVNVLSARLCRYHR